jgi:hypothetical protein
MNEQDFFLAPQGEITYTFGRDVAAAAAIRRLLALAQDTVKSEFKQKISKSSCAADNNEGVKKGRLQRPPSGRVVAVQVHNNKVTFSDNIIGKSIRTFHSSFQK